MNNNDNENNNTSIKKIKKINDINRVTPNRDFIDNKNNREDGQKNKDKYKRNNMSNYLNRPEVPKKDISLEDEEVLIYNHGLSVEQFKTMAFEEILKVLLKDTNITDITYNGRDLTVQHNLKGRYKVSGDIPPENIFDFIKNRANPNNKEFCDTHPILDVEIRDFYTQNKNTIIRLNAVQESIAPYGNTMALRIMQPTLRIKETDESFASKEIFDLVKTLIRGNSNILISGRTGSGKTELQKFLLGFVRDIEKIVLIEDTKDTNLKDLYPNKNITSWVTNDNEENPIDFDSLIKASLRNNPDWIIVSETRGSEAYSMIKSGLSGHKIITTLHSDNAKSNIDRLIHMCKESYDLDQVLLGKMITDVFDIGIHLDYEISSSGTKRFICEIVEYLGYNNDGVIANPLFVLKSKPVRRSDGSVTYEKKPVTGKISQGLFNKLANKKALNKTIEKFIEEEYYDGSIEE